MGNTPICCNYKEKDLHGQDFNETENKGIRKTTVDAQENNNK